MRVADSDPQAVANATKGYGLALQGGDYVAAIEALAILSRTVTASASLPMRPALTPEQIASVVHAASTEDALYNLGAAIWSMDAYELLALDILAESGVRGSPDGIAAIGESLSWLGFSDRAIQWLETAIAHGSERGAWLSGLLGEALIARDGAGRRSVELLEGAAAEHSEFGVPYAKALRSQGDIDRACRVLEDLVEQGVYGAALQLGNLLWDEDHDADGAERAYREGIATRDAHSAYNLGLLLRSRGRRAEARAAFSCARRLGDPTPPSMD